MSFQAYIASLPYSHLKGRQNGHALKEAPEQDMSAIVISHPHFH